MGPTGRSAPSSFIVPNRSWGSTEDRKSSLLVAERKNKPRIRSVREYRICRIGSQRLARPQRVRRGAQLLRPHPLSSRPNAPPSVVMCFP
jgi:hypothetical protein